MMFFAATAFFAIASVSAAPLLKRQDACDAVSCAAALGPTGVGCVSAAVKLGADPFADAGCVAGIANLGANTPAQCKACIDKIGAALPEPVKDVADTVKDTAGDAIDSIKGLFSRQEEEKCDIAKCGIAAAPTGVGCVSAAVALGANPLADAGCAAGLLNLGVNTPAACKPCLSKITDKLPEPVGDAIETVQEKASDAIDTVTDGIKGLFSREDAVCDAAKCGIAAAPTGVGCVSAAVELGANPFADAGCAAGLINLGVNTPEVCKPCLAKITDKLPEPVKEVADTVQEKAGDAVDAVKDGLSSLF